MTEQEIQHAVQALTDTAGAHWGRGTAQYRKDRRLILALSRAAQTEQGQQAAMRFHLRSEIRLRDLAIESYERSLKQRNETLRRKRATHEAELEAKDFTISCLREEIRRLRPELKDCIARMSLADLPTTDPKVAAFTGVEYIDPLGPLKNT